MNPASREQIVALPSLYSKLESHSIQDNRDTRAERLSWASRETGRVIGSFAELSRDEARMLIDGLKGSIGQAISQPPQPWRKVRARDRADAAGTAGRHGHDSSVIQMANADDLARIEQALSRLGWTRDQFEAWLRSARSPLKDKTSGIIRTVAEANKVWWGLKNMLVRSGNWKSGQKRVRQALKASI
jgi:hypothetical protein